jgi:hypothetical protein
MKHCVMCNDPLPRSIDEYGVIGAEVCQVCYLKVGDDLEIPETWYGLGPHTHSYDENGMIIIGGTTFDPLPEPETDGSYLVNGARFVPDPKAPGCGVWSRMP